MKKINNKIDFNKIGKKITNLYKKIWINKKYRKIFLGSLIGLMLLIMLIVIVSNSKKLSSLEERELKETSNSSMSYIEEIENVKEDDISIYINYAMEYNYNENDKTSLTLNNMKKLLEGVFNKTFSTKDIEKIGITPNMLDKNITYDPGTKTFKIDKSTFSYADIAQTKIVTYQIEKMKKTSKSKFEVIYNKYVVSNPYAVLNYYDNLNNTQDSDKKTKKTTKSKNYDTTPIFNYLTGKEKLKVMKTYITDEAISGIKKTEKKAVSEKGQVKVKYIIKDGKILISEIKSKDKKIKF